MRPLLFATKPAKPVLWAGTVLVLLGCTCRRPGGYRSSGIWWLGITQPINHRSTDLFAGSFTMGSQAYSLSDVQIRLTFTLHHNDIPAGKRFDRPLPTVGHRLFTFDQSDLLFGQ